MQSKLRHDKQEVDSPESLKGNIKMSLSEMDKIIKFAEDI